MKNLRAPAVPLVTNDPYLNIWSASDCLYDDLTRHWTGHRNAMTGLLKVDGECFRFMGKVQTDSDRYYTEPSVLPQKSVDIQPMTTEYIFENQLLRFTLRFMTPLFLDRPEILSRPLTYISYEAELLDGKGHDITVWFDFSADIAANQTSDKVNFLLRDGHLAVGTIGQPILEKKGDDLRIDWGYLQIHSPQAEIFAGLEQSRKDFVKGEEATKAHLDTPYTIRRDQPALCARFDAFRGMLCICYDDIKAIEYFGKPLDAYWKKDGKSFSEMIQEAVSDFAQLSKDAEAFNRGLLQEAIVCGGKEYADLLALAYRQAIAAHKTVWDRETGELLFISKECFSNGCAATVDVTYPSIPLFLIYNPEFVKGMLRPIFKYAAMPEWEYDFAPHDVGCYPLLNGQVYAGNKLEWQMPIEECGNMLLAVAAVCMAEKSAGFAKAHQPLLEQWADYLMKNGLDPENQLCTDDFAGHLAHNVNLSAKAIMGIAAWGMIKNEISDGSGDALLSEAKSMAAQWKANAKDGGHYRLAFDKPDTWSVKYNLVWDKIFGLGIFDEDIFEQELDYYLTRFNRYGLPLDCRKDYTKNDWLMWSTMLADNPLYTEKIIETMWEKENQTMDRVPLNDWYDTKTARQIQFQNRTVVGGLFIRLLKF